MDVGQGVRRGTRYRDRPGGLALLFLSSVGDPACRHEGDGEGDGEKDQRPGIALHRVGEGGGVSLSSGLAYRAGLAFGRVEEAATHAGKSAPDALLDPGADLPADDLGVHVLAKIPHVRGHAAPDLEHLPFYA